MWRKTFAAEIDPEQVLRCHCADCQTLSGAAYRSVAPTVRNSFRLLSGKLTTYIKIAEHGTPRQQYYCRSAQHRVQNLSPLPQQ